MEVSIKHDDLYAKAWECEYERPIFDAENNNVTLPNSPEIAVQSDLYTKERWNTPGNSRKWSPEVFPQTEELCEVTDTYPYMEPDGEAGSEQHNRTPTTPRSS